MAARGIATAPAGELGQPLLDGRLRITRATDEPADPLRGPFHVDRDRILATKAFRRLGAKTQVFIAPEGDHYRTRLTHTLAVAAISRTAARALGLDEDLAEAIALGHDLGHTPFGHTGEAALNAVSEQHLGRPFRHNEHSLRIVDLLARDGRGLNLTDAVRDGILTHTGPRLPATLEGRIVRIADRFAYVNHDIDDAIRAGLLVPADLPAALVAVLGDSGAARIDLLVADLVAASSESGDICQSPEVAEAFAELRGFMFERVYLGEVNDRDRARVEEFLPRMVDTLLADPSRLPGAPHRAADTPAAVAQAVIDHVAGMTDRYCLRLMRELFLPREWRLDERLLGIG